MKMSKEETLLELRAYQTHPTFWEDIVNDVKANIDHFTLDARKLYKNSIDKQLRDRVSSRFGMLLAVDNEAII